MWNGESSAIDPPVNGKEPQRGCPNDCGLCSAHLRKGCCMLLELTRRCNLECPVCYASAGKCGDDDVSIVAAPGPYADGARRTLQHTAIRRGADPA